MSVDINYPKLLRLTKTKSKALAYLTAWAASDHVSMRSRVSLKYAWPKVVRVGNLVRSIRHQAAKPHHKQKRKAINLLLWWSLFAEDRFAGAAL